MRRVLVLAAGLLIAASGGLSAGDTIGRLGADVVPVSQDVRLELDPRNANYTGSVAVTLEVKRPVSDFAFHAEAMTLRSAILTRSGAGAPIAVTTAPADADGLVRAKAAEPLAPGRYVLAIDFENDFDTRALGLYRLETAGRAYAFTQFEAVDGRKAFPCWDEPSFKIPWRMTLTVPEADAAITNTSEESSTTKDGKRTIVFRRTRPLPSYLIAVAVGPLDAVPIPGTSVPARVIVPRGSAALAADAVRMTPPLLAALEKYFGSRHPYEKLDLIAVPEYWYGAMENAGAIVFKEDILLLDPATASDEEREDLAGINAHEIAHMWFGDLVTMAWWDDLWLNESFASWMGDKIVEEVYPNFRLQARQVRAMQRVMGADALLSTRTIRQKVDSVASLLQSADGLAYTKGSSVLAMTESWLGPEVFRKGVLAYLKAHADGNATGDDLWNALSAASKKDVAAVLSSFLDQPGVPVVTATPLPGGRVKLTQSRFLNAGAAAPKPQLWRIPVLLDYPEGGSIKTQRVLLSEAETIVKLDTKSTPAWVHPNGGEAGYYRWSVPHATLDAIVADAPARLDVRERIGLLGNAAALLEAGQLGGDAYLRILQGFAGDPDPLVTKGVVDGLESVREVFFSEADDPRFAAYVRRLLRPALDRIGSAPRPGEPEATTGLRADLFEALSEWGGDEAAAAECRRLARIYLDDPKAVPPSLAGVALRGAARRGDAALYETYRSRFESATIPAERARYLDALSSFSDPALIDRALAYVFEGPLRPQERLAIPRRVADRPAGREPAWRWMTTNYGKVAELVPPDFIVFMPYFAEGCSESRLAAAKTFFAEPRHAPPGTDKELAKVGESVTDCARLNSREGDAVRRYLAVP